MTGAAVYIRDPRSKEEQLLGTLGEEAAIGQSLEAELRLNDLRCSGIHALIERDEKTGSYTLTDLGSRYGTYLKGRKIQSAPLREGAVFVIGSHQLVLRHRKAIEDEKTSLIQRQERARPGHEDTSHGAEHGLDPDSAPGPERLQATLYWGDQIIEQKLFQPGEDITVGTQLDASFGFGLQGTHSEDKPFTVARYKKEILFLHVPKEASGLIWVGKDSYSIDHLRHKDKSSKSFGDLKLKLQSGDRADVHFGELTLSFRFVHPAIPDAKDLIPTVDKPFLKISAIVAGMFAALSLFLTTHQFETKPTTLEDIPKELKKAVYKAGYAKAIKRKRSAIGELTKESEGGRAGGEEGKATVKQSEAPTPPKAKEAKEVRVAKKAEPEKTAPSKSKSGERSARRSLVKPVTKATRHQIADSKSKRAAGAVAQAAPAKSAAPAEPVVDLDAAFSISTGPKSKNSPTAGAVGKLEKAGNTVGALTEGGHFARGTKGTGAGGGGKSVGIVGARTGDKMGGALGAGDEGLLKTQGREIGNAEIIEEVIIEGGLDRNVIANIIRRYLPQIRHCYEQQLVHKPNLRGKVTVAFTIAGNGSVKSSRVHETSLKDSETEGCMLSKILGWKFPKPRGGGTVTVKYPFILMSQKGG